MALSVLEGTTTSGTVPAAGFSVGVLADAGDPAGKPADGATSEGNPGKDMPGAMTPAGADSPGTAIPDMGIPGEFARVAGAGDGTVATLGMVITCGIAVRPAEPPKVCCWAPERGPVVGPFGPAMPLVTVTLDGTE